MKSNIFTLQELQIAYQMGQGLFEGIEIDSSSNSNDLSVRNFSFAHFVNCWFHSVVLENINFESALFEKCNLKSSQFLNCNLNNSSWIECPICNISICNSSLRDLKVKKSHAYGVEINSESDFVRYVTNL